MSIFSQLESSSAAQATRKAGIDKLIPSMVIDDFLFEPCGYSMNGISKNVSIKERFKESRKGCMKFHLMQVKW